MNRNAKNRYTSAWWAVDLPHGWEATREDGATVFTNTNSPGTLRVSAARSEDVPVEDADLKEFANERVGKRAPLRPVKLGWLTGLTANYTRDDCVWYEWWLKNGFLMVYCTYTVPQGEGVAGLPADIIAILSGIQATQD